MKKITVKNLIEFRGRSKRSKITFVNNLRKVKEKTKDDSGGDYWISCLSAIRNSFKYNDENLLDEKIDLLSDKIEATEIKRIKDQFSRNIDILNNFKEFDFQNLKPKSEVNFIKQSKKKSILDINGLPIEAKPCHVYTFSVSGSEEIAGVWFIAKLNGYKRSELGMFTDILYRYLENSYSREYYVNPHYCIAVDLYNGQEVIYSDIKNGKVPRLIESTIEELKTL